MSPRSSLSDRAGQRGRGARAPLPTPNALAIRRLMSLPRQRLLAVRREGRVASVPRNSASAGCNALSSSGFAVT